MICREVMKDTYEILNRHKMRVWFIQDGVASPV